MPCSCEKCPVKVDLSRFERCPDERQRVQLQVIEILTHEEDGRAIESTEEEKASAISECVAPSFAAAWNRGHRCPDKIARIIDGSMLADVLETVAR